MADIKDGEDLIIEMDPVIEGGDKPADKPGEGGAADKPVEGGDQPTPEEALSELRTQLEMERTGRQNAERQRDAALNNSDKSATDVRSANLQMVTTAIESLKANEEVLKGNLANAMATQDWAQVAEVQSAMGKNAAKLVQLETGKEAMEAEAKQPVRRMAAPADPVEAFAAQLSEPSAKWIRAHPQCVTDARMQQRMLAAHNIALTDGLSADTAPYFAKVEEIMGFKKAAAPAVETEESALSEAAGATKHRTGGAPPAAPVTRSGTGTGTRPNTVRLSAAELEAAAASGLTPKEYAEQKLKLQKEGRLN